MVGTAQQNVSITRHVPVSINYTLTTCSQVDLLFAEAWHLILLEGQPSGDWGSVGAELRASTRRPRWSHRFSMGFRSGEIAGHSIWVAPVSNSRSLMIDLDDPEHRRPWRWNSPRVVQLGAQSPDSCCWGCLDLPLYHSQSVGQFRADWTWKLCFLIRFDMLLYFKKLNYFQMCNLVKIQLNLVWNQCFLPRIQISCFKTAIYFKFLFKLFPLFY